MIHKASRKWGDPRGWQQCQFAASRTDRAHRFFSENRNG